MELQDAVYLIDCIWEYFILVGQRARGKRRDISLAISVAQVLSPLYMSVLSVLFLIATVLQQLSSRVASSRPFSPTIHALILPSRLPLDLRLQFRGLDEARLVGFFSHFIMYCYEPCFQNNEVIPDHMNILSSVEGLEHVRSRLFPGGPILMFCKAKTQVME